MIGAQKLRSKINVSTGHMQKTGGFPNSGIELSDLEIRLMAVKGWSCVYGDNHTEVTGYGEVEGIENGYNTSDLIGLNVTTEIKNTEPNILQTHHYTVNLC